MSTFLRRLQFLFKYKRYRVKVTPSGLVFVIITIVVGGGAVNTGNNLLFLLTSLLLGLMTISGLISMGNLSFLNISMRPPREIFAGIPSPFKLIIHKNRGHSFFLRCETPFGTMNSPFVQGKLNTSFWLTFSERGKGRIKKINVQSGFPMGFFRRYKTYPVSIDALVYPMPIPCAFPAFSGENLTGQTTSTLKGEMGDETKELREYRSSDPVKWIDWKATARKGQMVTRDFYYLEGDTLCIDLSRKGDRWERKLSEACYLILEGDRKKLSIAMNLQERQIEPGRGEKHKKKLLEALALA